MEFREFQNANYNPVIGVKSSFGIAEYHPSKQVYLPDNIRKAIKDYFDPFSYRYKQIERCAICRQGFDEDYSNRVGLFFSDIDVKSIETQHLNLHAPLLVQLTATTLNYSGYTINLADMPSLYCSETMEVIPCSMKIGELRPGLATRITYSIVARDVFTDWLLLQTFDGFTSIPMAVKGLDSLPMIIANALAEGFAERKELLRGLAITVFGNGGRAEEELNRVYRVMPTGECFHIDPGCGGRRCSQTMSAKEAYKFGYRPCQKCVGFDWWRGCGSTDGEKIHLLSTCANEPFAIWKPSQHNY